MTHRRIQGRWVIKKVCAKMIKQQGSRTQGSRVLKKIKLVRRVLKPD